MRQRSPVWLLLVVAVVLAGCGSGAAVQTSETGTVGGEIFQVALPRLVVDLDAEGNPSLLGISPSLLGMFGVDTAAMKVPADTVKQMMDAGIQHIEIAAVGDRIMFFVNSQPVPHLGWSATSLPRALDVADVFMSIQNAQMIRQLLPLVTRLGLDVVLRFPHGDAAVIPMVDVNQAKTFRATPGTEPAGMIIKFEVKFDEQGRPGLLGLSADDLAALGVSGVAIAPDLLARIQKANIQHMEFQTQPDGAFVYVNGEPLPTVIWDTQLLQNLMDVVGKLAADSELLPLLEALVPYVDRADIGILVHFPIAAGQEPIPAQMHD
ncbi:MAG: hypothetical protein BWY52_01274 [Chloroflexi bacterium ADurb.Bin325]|nr:MAG: hypothetical protein BWY52_01274 [Chloroflexi bacterium ADurb.Bin325]